MTNIKFSLKKILFYNKILYAIRLFLLFQNPRQHELYADKNYVNAI